MTAKTKKRIDGACDHCQRSKPDVYLSYDHTEHTWDVICSDCRSARGVYPQ